MSAWITFIACRYDRPDAIPRSWFPSLFAVSNVVGVGQDTPMHMFRCCFEELPTCILSMCPFPSIRKLNSVSYVRPPQGSQGVARHFRGQAPPKHESLLKVSAVESVSRSEMQSQKSDHVPLRNLDRRSKKCEIVSRRPCACAWSTTQRTHRRNLRSSSMFLSVRNLPA